MHTSVDQSKQNLTSLLDFNAKSTDELAKWKKESNKMPGYKHPYKYCGKLVSADENVCPFCGTLTPLDLQDAPNAELQSKRDKFDAVAVVYHCKLTVLSVANLLSLGITAKTVTNRLALLVENAKLCNRPLERNA